jgi:acetylglutamate kinase
MNPLVVKVGGSTLGSHDTALEDIAALQAAGQPAVVVHGGGNAATEWLKVHGVTSEFVDGLRVTGRDAIDVVVAVFAGLVNKELVASLSALGANAVGLSGVDGSILATREADPRLGFVGEVIGVDRRLLDLLLREGYLPVLSPIGFWQERPRQLMNVNADTVAGEVASALAAEALVFLTDVPAVRGSNGESLAELRAADVEALITSGTATAGMIPKLRACAKAAAAGTRCSIVDGREAHALRAALGGVAGGTLVSA